MGSVNAQRGRVPNRFAQNAVTLEERERLIAEAAYFRAKRRGFKDGDAKQDWREAEREVDELFHVVY